MREVQEGFSNTQSSTRIAILAAMNITDELFNARQSGDSNDNELDEEVVIINRNFRRKYLIVVNANILYAKPVIESFYSKAKKEFLI